MYRDDDAARAARASALIDEIAELERQKLQQATMEQRLDAAKRELSTLHGPAPAPAREKPPSLLAHVLVFGATAGAAYLGYTLLI
ncbi:MAG TPA: hypothetical protein VM513_01900 [Kofleriaceae bacterium]|jgi:hypothetical protein|nr:hypothetical protein [Kofleriaceae bacterium]